MTPRLLSLVCDPRTKAPLTLADAVTEDGEIVSGRLVAGDGRSYAIRDGIPRFVDSPSDKKTVDSFADEWNTFNFKDFEANWLNHTIRNTFGSTDALRGRLIVDAGGGSGAQSLWMLESGADHVILLELSDAVDGVIRRNLRSSTHRNYDIVQCSIDAPPLRPQSIDGIVICHNVIQHTESVEKTARALYEIVAPGGEFVFNCYPSNDEGIVRWLRRYVVYEPLRALLSRSPRAIRMGYSRLMALLRFVPLLGLFLEKAGFCSQGDVSQQRAASRSEARRHRYRSTLLNTFDRYGAHAYQHLKRDSEIRQLVTELQPDSHRVLNTTAYFARPQPIGCALRIEK